MNTTDSKFLEELKADLIQACASILDDMFGTTYAETAGVLVVINGSESREMYDDQPGIFFHVDQQLGINIPRYSGMSISQLKELALAEFQEYLANAEMPECEGRFSPSSFRLENYRGEVLDLYEYRIQGSPGSWTGSWGWASERNDYIIPREQFKAVEAEINRLYCEAREESRWDNFESSKKLHRQAKELAERLSFSLRHVSVVRAA